MRGKIWWGVAMLGMLPGLTQANEAAVVRLSSGCSGVCVSADGLILTADHCGDSEVVRVTFPDGSVFSAELEHSPPINGIDEVQTYRVRTESRLPFAAVASTSVKSGDLVWSAGYPAGNYQLNRGTVSRVGFTIRDGSAFQVKLSGGVVTDWGSDAGNSGGPLFNAADEVVGILSMSGDAKSYWIGLDSIRVAMNERQVLTAYDRQTVVVFTADGCGPCERLKLDAKAGRLGEYEFRFVNWNPDLRAWSDPALAKEFSATAEAPAGLGFPVIWVRGTDKYRVGYEPDRRGGLVGWIASVFDGLARLIVGEKPSPKFPPLDRSSPAAPPAEDAALSPQVNSALESVKRVEAGLLKAKEDIGKLQSANPLTKLKGVVALKSDVADIREDAATALSEIKGVKDSAKEKPLTYLWGLFGVLSGLVHRRFAH